MDFDGKVLKVGSLVYFNRASSYYREDYVVAKITHITSKGTLTIDIFPMKSIVLDDTPVLSNEILKVDLNDKPSLTKKLTPMRGKKAGNGGYRYPEAKGHSMDVYIYAYEEGQEIKQSNCY